MNGEMRSRGATLLEVAAAVAAGVLLACVGGAILAGARTPARRATCETNLGALGTALHAAAADQRSTIASLAAGGPGPRGLDGAAALAASIIERYGRRTGLPAFGPAAGVNIPSVLEQHNHLPLIEYLGDTLPMDAAVCPSDAARLAWRTDLPVDDERNAYRPRREANLSRAAWLRYAASYQLVPAASLSDGGAGPGAYAQGGFHDLYELGGEPLAARRMDEVSLPAQKVAMHDAFQRHAGADLFYAYPEAVQPLLMFDGSVGQRRTCDAAEGWDRREPSSPRAAQFTYDPDPAFEPAPPGRRTVMRGYYRWTRGGLSGADFKGGLGETPAK